MKKTTYCYIMGLVLMSWGAYLIGMEYAHSRVLAMGIGSLGWGVMLGLWMVVNVDAKK